MKIIVKSCMLLLSMLLQFILQAQCGGDVKTLPVNTGYNYEKDTASILVSNPRHKNGDVKWKVQRENSMVKSAYLVDYSNTFIDPLNSSNWISYHEDPSFGLPAGETTYLFEFCLNEGFEEPSCTLDIRADDEFILKFNGQLHAKHASAADYIWAAYPDNPIQMILDPSLFKQNKNKIEITVNNKLQVREKGSALPSPTALNVKGRVLTKKEHIQPYCKCL